MTPSFPVEKLVEKPVNLLLTNGSKCLHLYTEQVLYLNLSIIIKENQKSEFFGNIVILNPEVSNIHCIQNNNNNNNNKMEVVYICKQTLK